MILRPSLFLFLFGINLFGPQNLMAKTTKSNLVKAGGFVKSLSREKESSPAPMPLSLRWDSAAEYDHWLFESGTQFKGPTRLAPLALIKKMEFTEKYEECTQQILNSWTHYLEFKGWMALQGTRCLVFQLKFLAPYQKGLYQKWWTHLTNQESGLFFGPWTAELQDSWSELAHLVLKAKALPLAFRSEVADQIRRAMAKMSKPDRKELFQVIVERLSEQGQSGLAEAISKREDLLGNGKKEVVPLGGPPQLIGATPPFKDSSEISSYFAEEKKLNDLMQDFGRMGKWVDVIETGVQMLDRFPTGKWAGSGFDKIQQTYFKLWSNAESANDKKGLERYLEVAKLLHPSLQTVWAKAAHRKGDFEGAYHLAQWALAEDEKSPMGADLLFIAGRSAYITGRYQEAIAFFNRLVQYHYGYADIYEARFRRALAWIRIGEDLKAEEALADLVNDQLNKIYGASSLYWLIRLKQKRKGDWAPWYKAMQDKYALTYYGLRLNAESNGQKVVLPSNGNTVLAQSWVLAPQERRQWERVQDLVSAGWYEASQGEMNSLVLDGTPEHRFLWAVQLAKVFAFPQAIQILNQLTDEDTRWRNLDFLRSIYPRPLKTIVHREAEKNALHPHLVYSLIRQESAFSMAVSSKAQAQGLMQLIPQTASEIAQDLRIKKFHSDQIFHPETNVKFGTYYLAKVIRQFNGNVSVGLAAYNAGPQRLKKFFVARPTDMNPMVLSQEDPWSDLWLEELPWLETNLYVKSILRNRVIYNVLEQGYFVWPTPVWKDLFKGTVMNPKTEAQKTL